MRLTNGVEVFEVKDAVQVAAFKAAGWIEQKAEEKPKRQRKAKAEGETD